MKIKSVILVGSDSWQISGTENRFRIGAKRNSNDEFTNYICAGRNIFCWNKTSITDITVTFVRPDNILRGVHFFEGTDNQIEIPEFWSPFVKTVCLFTAKNDEYLTLSVIVSLNPEIIPTLINMGSYSSDKQFNYLIKSILPKCVGEHVDVLSSRNGHPFVLFVEPEELPPFNQNVLNDILSYLGLKETAALPHLLSDVLLTFTLGIGSPSESITTIRLNPLPCQSDNSIYIPSTVMELSSYINYIHILRHLNKRLKELPVYKLTFNQYVSELEKSKGLFKGYEYKFLRDQKEALDIRLRVIQNYESLLDKIEKNYISKFKNSKKSLTVNTEIANPFTRAYSYDVFKSLDYDLLKAKKEIENSMKTILAKENVIVEYLRDEAACSNHILQRRINWLTIVTVVIAIIALFIGLLPDGIKELWYAKLIK